METTFILHGGMLSYDDPDNDTFFQALTQNLEDGDVVLFVGFARRDKSKRQEIYERDKGYILAQTDKQITVENAEPETLVEQAKAARAIFVTGGDTAGLQADLASQPGFLDAIKGKVYAGSSAGAMITSTYNFSCAANEVRGGLGWLPIRLMVHYGNPDFNATTETLKILEQYPSDLELVVLPECKWQTIEVDL